MESEQTPLESNQDSHFKKYLCRVTPLSRYLALALFVALPFIGGYVGYQLAPVKVVEVEKPQELPSEDQAISAISKLGFYGFIRNDLGEYSKYAVIGNGIYSAEGADPGNGGKYEFIEIPEVIVYDGMNGLGGKFSVENHAILEYEEGSGLEGYHYIDLGIAGDKVYFKSQLLEGIDAANLVVDHETNTIRDSDTVYHYEAKGWTEYFVEIIKPLEDAATNDALPKLSQETPNSIICGPLNSLRFEGSSYIPNRLDGTVSYTSKWVQLEPGSGSQFQGCVGKSHKLIGADAESFFVVDQDPAIPVIINGVSYQNTNPAQVAQDPVTPLAYDKNQFYINGEVAFSRASGTFEMYKQQDSENYYVRLGDEEFIYYSQFDPHLERLE